MNKAILFFIWIIFIFWMLSIGYKMVNLPSTIGNTVGIAVLAAVALLSIKTKCFTSIKFNNKNNEK